tara:strand:- start:392 stop:583 length:192 start_codon:yes stop_codon:yes gene_type:complete
VEGGAVVAGLAGVGERVVEEAGCEAAPEVVAAWRGGGDAFDGLEAKGGGGGAFEDAFADEDAL